MKDPNDTKTQEIADAISNGAGNLSASEAKRLSDGLVLVNVVVSGLSGERVLQESKTLVNNQEVDADITRKGAIQWFPKEELKFSKIIARRSQREIDQIAVRYGRLSAVPIGELTQLLSILDKHKAEYDAAVNALEQNYDSLMDGHKAAHPTMASEIEKVAIQKDDFVSRFKYEVLPPIAFKAFMDEHREDTEIVIKDAILAEIMERSKSIFEENNGKSLIRKNGVRRFLTDVRDYAYNFSDGNPLLERIVDDIDETISDLGGEKVYRDAEVTKFLALAYNASKLEKLESSLLITPEPEPEPEVPDEPSPGAMATGFGFGFSAPDTPAPASAEKKPQPVADATPPTPEPEGAFCTFGDAEW